MKAAVAHVIQCALDVQEKNGEYVTSVGVILKVKIGIAAGEVNVLYIGNDEARSYLEMGRAVDAVNKAENYCTSGGDIVVGPSAWCHCAGLTTDHEWLPDQKHVKVKALLAVVGPAYEMRRTIPVTESMQNVDRSVTNLVVRPELMETPAVTEETETGIDRRFAIAGIEMMAGSSATTTTTPAVVATESTPGANPSPAIHRSSSASSIVNKKGYKSGHEGGSRLADTMVRRLDLKTEEPSAAAAAAAAATTGMTGDVVPVRRLRRTVVTLFDEETIDKLKLYVAVPVLRKIEEQQPLEYLSEMRQVSILFINLLFEKCTKIELAWTMQHCFDVIYAACKRMQGVVSKIFVFDKGCTFIVVFGLPGFKHENDCAHALVCADLIFSNLDKMKRIERTSIGVTTGPTYCGVVGHFHRHEYTVIGRKVNMAARLMMHYPGKVFVSASLHLRLRSGYVPQSPFLSRSPFRRRVSAPSSMSFLCRSARFASSQYPCRLVCMCVCVTFCINI